MIKTNMGAFTASDADTHLVMGFASAQEMAREGAEPTGVFVIAEDGQRAARVAQAAKPGFQVVGVASLAELRAQTQTLEKVRDGQVDSFVDQAWATKKAASYGGAPGAAFGGQTIG